MSRTVELSHPMTGRWLVRNSPADRVPSHGTHLFATSLAIDLVPVDEHGVSAPLTLRGLLRPEPPERFVGFGRPVLAPVAGTVSAAHDGEEDHAAHRGLPSLGYAVTQGARAAAGFVALAGNHLILRTADDAYVALCHLQRGSLLVKVGDVVERGQRVAACGSSGNSIEPHLHLQVMTEADPTRAQALPFTLGGVLPSNGEIVEGPAG